MSGAAGYALRKGYESIPRELLQPDPGAMSARALGVLCHLLSRPAGWVSSGEKLSKTFREGRDAMETALGELEALGYLARRKVQRDGGRFGWVWVYGDDPAYVAEHLAAALAEIERHGSVSAARTETGNPGHGEVVAFPQVTPSPGFPRTAEPSTDNQGS